MNLDELQRWVGRDEVREDVATAAPVRGMAATLDHETPCEEGDEVPPLWHWGYFLPTPPSSKLEADGYAVKDGLLPPIDLPRRMWAGSRLQFLRPLRVGEAISCRSTVVNIASKQGRAGPLYFVKVRRDISVAGKTAILEEQDIVYRGPASSTESVAPAVMPTKVATWRRRIKPSPMLLFRYSALTFNAHRIHYDRPYAEREEGYSGLVVHGPLIATLLLDHLRRELPEARVREFSFRANQPLLDIADFWTCSTPDAEGRVHLWAEDESGALAASATAFLD